MTKNEAIKAVRKHMATWQFSEGLVNSFEALGIIKFDEPKTATERALKAINDMRAHDMGRGAPIASQTFLEMMDAASVRIVDKD